MNKIREWLIGGRGAKVIDPGSMIDVKNDVVIGSKSLCRGDLILVIKRVKIKDPVCNDYMTFIHHKWGLHEQKFVDLKIWFNV